MDKPNISIVIVNWNGKRWLKKCIDSLLNQTYSFFEVIFVDNASFDGSVEFLESNYRDSRIKIIKSKENLGFAGGNNLGIKNARGEYLLLLNNDTWVDENFLSRLISNFIDNKCDVISPRIGDYYSKKTKNYATLIDFFGHSTLIFGQDSINIKDFYLNGVCLLFKKDFYFETLGLDNDFFMYFEEIDWFWRLQLLNKKIHQDRQVIVYHFGSGSTGKGVRYKNFLWRNQNTLQMLLKNYKWFSLFWVLPLYLLQNLVEILFFVITLKPQIAISYIQGWMFNIININKIIKKRRWIQNNRQVGDLEIMKKMYFGFGKFKHLINFYKNAKSL